MKHLLDFVYDYIFPCLLVLLFILTMSMIGGTYLDAQSTYDCVPDTLSVNEYSDANIDNGHYSVSVTKTATGYEYTVDNGTFKDVAAVIVKGINTKADSYLSVGGTAYCITYTTNTKSYWVDIDG